jgi:hypothetical protein
MCDIRSPRGKIGVPWLVLSNAYWVGNLRLNCMLDDHRDLGTSEPAIILYDFFVRSYAFNCAYIAILRDNAREPNGGKSYPVIFAVRYAIGRSAGETCAIEPQPVPSASGVSPTRCSKHPNWISYSRLFSLCAYKGPIREAHPELSSGAPGSRGRRSVEV